MYNDATLVSPDGGVNIDKKRDLQTLISLNIVKTVAKVALTNPFFTYCNTFLEITDQCVQFNINECHSLILKSRYYIITDEMSSNININVLKDMIDIRDGMKECASLGVNDVNDIIDEICLN